MSKNGLLLLIAVGKPKQVAELAESIHSVDVEHVLRLGAREWYDFLNKYFGW